MKKIISIVGTRPNLIKLAALSSNIAKHFDHIIVNTGQHYDKEMSDIFFKELNIKKPDINLKIGSGTHAQTTAKVLTETENIYLKIDPDIVVIYGDVNSSLGAAISASKLNIPIAHIEAGVRSYDRKMPEEVNRVLIDHVSTLLFCPSKTSVINLRKEGIKNNVFLVGDTMYDIFLKTRPNKDTPIKFGLHPKQFLFLTIHRQENTRSPMILKELIKIIDSLGIKTIMPVHPRTKNVLQQNKIGLKNINLVDPVGFANSINLQRYSKFVVTDSGGIQKEAYWLKVPCITLRDTTEWPETVKSGWNILVGSNLSKIPYIIKNYKPRDKHSNLYGNGQSGKKIADELKKWTLKN